MHGEVHESHENESIVAAFFAQCEVTGKIHQYVFCNQRQVWEFFNELEMPRRAAGDQGRPDDQ